MDKNKAIVDYLLTCTGISGSTLYFNFVNAKNSVKQFITLPQDKAIDTSYIDGGVLKRYSLTIISFLAINDIPIPRVSGYSDQNISSMAEVQTLIDWISTQNASKVFPDFGAYCDIQSISTTTSNPELSQIDTTVTPPLAKYTFTIQVDYIDNTEKIWN